MRLRAHRASLRRRLLSERGQSLALAALLVLFVFMAVMLTFAIGDRTRQKIKLQSLADSAAYSAAVAEARTFNFFAWSNRARVAHDVAVLSVFSHISYVTNFEAIMAATGKAFKTDGNRYLAYAPICIATRGQLCCKVGTDRSKLNDAGEVYAGDQYPGAGWMKNQRDRWDKLLGRAAQFHYDGIGTIHSDQKKMYDNLHDKVLKGQAMANDLAKKVDGKIEGPTGGADKQSMKHLEAVVLNIGPTKSDKAYDDWNEIESATRLNSFVTSRTWNAPPSWWIALGKAMSKAYSQCQFIPPSVSYGGGNSKTVTKAPGSIQALESAIHDDQKDQESGWAGPKGYGAEDHASVRVFNPVCMGDPCPFPASDTEDADGGVYGDSSTGKHFWRDGAKTESDHAKHNFGAKNNVSESIYVYHARYIWNSDGEKNVWNHPHTVAVLTKEMGKSSPKEPYEFDFHLGLPVPMTFQTHNGKGDSQAGGKMAAIAGGLVYYHKPKGSDGWQETPSFWNPFWRAKLHPLTREDWENSTQKDHAASRKAGDWSKSVNY